MRSRKGFWIGGALVAAGLLGGLLAFAGVILIVVTAVRLHGNDPPALP